MTNTTYLIIELPASRAMLQCHWKWNSNLSPEFSGSKTRCYSTVDLFCRTVSVQSQASEKPGKSAVASMWEADGNGVPLQMIDDESSDIGHFLLKAIRNNIAQYGSRATALKMIIPAVDGYIVRNDQIQRRFLSYDLAEEVVDFTSPRQSIRAWNPQGELKFSSLLKHAVGAILLKDLPVYSHLLVESALLIVENEATRRLDFPWIIETPIPEKRLAIVEGRPHPSDSAAAEGPLRAAAALGIKLVILDEEGHWLQDSNKGHLRDEFIVCDLNLDENLPDRIVDAVSRSRKPVDGIVTYSDKHLTATARAAELLGLGNYPSRSIEVCTDKKKMRDFASPGMPSLSIDGAISLQEHTQCWPKGLEFPLIVKPAHGNSSEGVCKVNNFQSLFTAVQRIEQNFRGRKILIEPYISGPEVDANLVLLNGEMLFCEINDDFPSPSEAPDQLLSTSFAETSTIMPSALPIPELSILKSSLENHLDRLNFRNGVFHIEARVQNSRVRYGPLEPGIELIKRHNLQAGAAQAPSCFLIEINARTPGHQESFAVEHTYGVDYYAMYTLLALRAPHHGSLRNDGSFPSSELARLKAVSQPFPMEIQYPMNIVFIPVTRGGIFSSVEPLPSTLMDYVVYHRIMMKEGDMIEHPEATGKWPFIAYFLVKAKVIGVEGRDQVRIVGHWIRANFQYSLA